MTSNDIDYDVMIVGGGPAGISTWLHLHKMFPEIASRSIVIEKESYPREKLCGGAVGGWSNIILKKLNIKIDVPTVKINKVECRFGKDSILLNQSEMFSVIQRKEFDFELVKSAKKRGLHVHESEKFLEYERKDDLLIVKTNLHQYNVKTLIGADGALSKVRKEMKLQNKPNLAPALEIFNPVNKNYDLEYENKKLLFDFSPIKKGLQGYLWHFPCLRDNKPYMNHGIGNFRILSNQASPSMKKIFHRDLLKRNIDISEKIIKGYPIHWLSKNDSISQKNILLVGDAAGIEPATGGGIHIALSYGEVAANTINEAFSKNNFSYDNYTKNIQSHMVGKFINKCTKLALGMYSGRINPLDAVQDIFNIKK
jgi:flavin-dependent dehydrogenase